MEHAVSIVATSATPTAVIIREATTWERFPTLWGELPTPDPVMRAVPRA